MRVRFYVALTIALPLTTTIATTITSAARAEIIVDRIAAVVGTHVVTLSELNRRSRFAVLRVRKDESLSPSDRDQKATETSKMYLDQMIDDQLVADAATRAKLTVSRDEVEKTIFALAAAQSISTPELFENARQKEGMDEQAYREEIRRQLLLRLVLTLRLAPKATASKQPAAVDAEAARHEYAKMIAELRAHTYVDIRL